MWGAEEALILGVGGPRAFFVNKNRSMKVLGRDNASNESPSNVFVKHDPERKLKMIVIKLVWGCLSVKYSKP